MNIGKRLKSGQIRNKEINEIIVPTQVLDRCFSLILVKIFKGCVAHQF